MQWGAGGDHSTLETHCYRSGCAQLRGRYAEIATARTRLSELCNAWTSRTHREAFRLVEENGFAATTVEQIAGSADVSLSTFFRYFPSRDFMDAGMPLG